MITVINHHHMASWENNRAGFWPTWQEHKVFFVLLTILLVALIAFTCMSAKKVYREAWNVGFSDQIAPTISVSATGSADIAPDIASVDVTVTKDGATAVAAQNAASEIMNGVIADIQALGVAEKDLRTSSFSTSEVYDYDVSPAVVTGYQSTQTLTVKIRTIDSTASIVQSAVEGGATSVSDIRYVVDDESATLAVAREEAVAQAKREAVAIAKSLSARLGKVVSYSESRGGQSPIYYGMGESLKAADTAAMPTVEVGENTIQMTVYLTFSLR